MNCPVCNKPMTTRTGSSFEVIGGKKWVYEYEEMFCEAHPNDPFQTGEQADAGAAAIRANRAAAAKLKKATV